MRIVILLSLLPLFSCTPEMSEGPVQEEQNPFWEKKIRELEPGLNGEMWATTHEHYGLYKIKNRDVEAFPFPKPIEVTCMESDEQGEIWIGTKAHGILHFSEPGNWEFIDTSNSCLSRSWILALAIEPNRALWVSGGDTSLIRMENGACEFFNRENSLLPNPYPLDIEIAGDEVWVTVAFEKNFPEVYGEIGLGKYTNGEFTIYPIPELGRGQMTELYVDRQQRVWFNCIYYPRFRQEAEQRTYMWKDEMFEIVNRDTDNKNEIYAATVREDNLGRVWMASKTHSYFYQPSLHYKAGGVFLLKNEVIRKIDVEEITPEQPLGIYDMEIDDENKAWIATSQGFWIIEQ